MDDSDLPSNSSLPLPPPFHKSFTKEHIAELSSIQASKSSTAPPSNLSPRQLLTQSDVPEHLSHLVPPPVPPDGKYTLFSLPTQYPPPQASLPPETPKLYSAASPSELLTLSRAVFLNYIELVDILVRNPDPSNWGPKWDDLRDLLRNCHDVCGRYAEWAVKRQVRVYLEAVLEKTEREREGLVGLKMRMESLEGEVKEGMVNGDANSNGEERLMNGERGDEKGEVMEVDEVWAELDEE